MIAPALRKIEADLRAMAADPEICTSDALKLQAIRVAAQAEMIERGISE